MIFSVLSTASDPKVAFEICKLTVQTAVGPSSTPINTPEFQRLKKEVSNYMEN